MMIESFRSEDKFEVPGVGYVAIVRLQKDSYNLEYLIGKKVEIDGIVIKCKDCEYHKREIGIGFQHRKGDKIGLWIDVDEDSVAKPIKSIKKITRYDILKGQGSEDKSLITTGEQDPNQSTVKWKPRRINWE